MAPHLCATELNSLHQWLSKGFETPEMLRRIAKQRERRGVEAPKLRQIQRMLHGASLKRGVLETRGRKKKLSSRNIKTLNAKRMDLIKKAKGEREVHWREIIQKARVPHVHPATAGRSLRAAGFAVAARTPRQKPMRSPDHEAIRVELCSKWMRRPATYFTDSVDKNHGQQTMERAPDGLREAVQQHAAGPLSHPHKGRGRQCWFHQAQREEASRQHKGRCESVRWNHWVQDPALALIAPCMEWAGSGRLVPRTHRWRAQDPRRDQETLHRLGGQ